MAARNQTLPQLLDAWRNSPYRDAAFRNYLSYEIGGQELGRPQDVQQALAESFTAIAAASRYPWPVDTARGSHVIRSDGRPVND